jgi:hypothetical protein
LSKVITGTRIVTLANVGNGTGNVKIATLVHGFVPIGLGTIAVVPICFV